MKIAIIGSGAMGCRFGVHFQRGGADVTLYDICKEHIDAINDRGLKITEEDGSVSYMRIPAVSSLECLGSADAAMLQTKSSQTENALRSVLPFLSPQSIIISVQNGVGNFDVIEEIVGKDRMIIGCTLTATTLTGLGAIRIDSFAHSDIQALGALAEPMSVEVRDTLERGGMETRVSENVFKEIWQKLSFNAAMNPITGITRLVVGHTGALGAETAARISEEVALVAEAEGVSIDREFALDLFRTATATEGGDFTHLTSMLQDVVKERRTEADAICGAVIGRARRHGIPVPHLETVYNLIRIIESNYPYQLSPDHPDPILS
ncbi:MAG: 2-dehydropantoate 2-reductase, partial [Clostridiales Family XIII bacterium]|nr:2-dehydropantoate 2-reductase [Clostridiales Family XIII bacterium]